MYFGKKLFFEILRCDPTKYTNDDPDFSVSRFRGKRIVLKKKILLICDKCLYNISRDRLSESMSARGGILESLMSVRMG